MSRFLDWASKALAIIGVLTLMTASGLQSVRMAEATPGPTGCPVTPIPNRDPGWFTCSQSSCPSPTDTCCTKPFTTSSGLACCSFLGYNC